jgi:hypothetical protein
MVANITEQREMRPGNPRVTVKPSKVQPYQRTDNRTKGQAS